MKIWLVDAFTATPLTGNPAAVILVEDFPIDVQCQQIAAELNLSETAFVKPLAENHFQLRWFTPVTEVKLCGHATLASAHTLYQERIANERPINFESLSGVLHVYQKEQGITLDFPLQKTGVLLNTATFQHLFISPIAAATEALDCIIIELENEKNIQELQIDPAQFMKFKYRGFIITAKANPPYNFISRYFAPRVGILEDPVTGSAHCKLADYWQQKLHKTSFLAYQASKRGGELLLEIKNDRVHITGKAVTIFKGEWVGSLLS